MRVERAEVEPIISRAGRNGKPLDEEEEEEEEPTERGDWLEVTSREEGLLKALVGIYFWYARVEYVFTPKIDA